MRIKLFENFLNESFKVTSKKDNYYEDTEVAVDIHPGNTGFVGTVKGTYGDKKVDIELFYDSDLELTDDKLDDDTLGQLADIIGNDKEFIRRTKIKESLVTEGKAVPTDYNTLVDAYNAFLKAVDIYDGYASENGVEKDNRYWGDMKELNVRIDKVSKVKQAKDVLDQWDEMVSVADKVLDGIDGLISETGGVGRYGSMSAVVKAKKLLGIKDRRV